MEPLLQSPQEFILKPITIRNILLLSPGRWNDVDYTELEIQKAYGNTDWNDRKFTSLYLDHQDTKERGVGNWVGYIKNKNLQGSSLYGDLEIWNPMIGAYLSQAKAKFGVSATLAGRENKQLGRMEDFHFESFSIVTDPACKPAMINLSKQVNMVADTDIQVVTMENETKEDLTELGDVGHKVSTWITYKDETGKKVHAYFDKSDKMHKGDEAMEVFKQEHPEHTRKENSVELESVKHRERRENIESVGDKKDFCSALKSAMADEAKAPGDYENLKSLTEDENVKNKIDGIISDEKRHYEILSVIEGNKELANEGSVAPIHTLEPVEIDKKKKKENSELNPSLVAIVLTEKLESDTIRKENSDIQILKGGIKMPEILENNKIEELAKPKAETDKEDAEELKVEPKAEDKADKKAEEDKEDKEEMSSDAILKQIKEMSADELVSYTNFVKAYLNENEAASAKEVTLAYGKSKADKKSEKELSASDLLASIDSRIASLKELDSSKKMTEMETKIQELSAKVKMPDRKTLSVAFESSQNSNVGMLGFLQHRIN